MTEFLTALKSDLLDRRFLPVLALLGVALLAALAYAVLGGGSASAPGSSPSASTGATGAAGAVAITQAAVPNKAVSETTSGAHHQSGAPRNPFAPLPSTQAKGSATSPSSSSAHASGASGSSSAGSSSSSGKGTSSAGGTSPATSVKPIAPPRRIFVHFHTTAQFGVVPAPVAGTPPPPVQLKEYKDMALDEPLPSRDSPQLVYLGVVLKTRKDAAFGLTGEAILHGSAVCKPSPSQCQAIVLGIGQTETLEATEPNGQPVTYELKLISISTSVSGSASTARTHAAFRGPSRTGRELLRRAGLSTLPGLRYSAQRGGLVPVARRAFAAHPARHRQ